MRWTFAAGPRTFEIPLLLSDERKFDRLLDAIGAAGFNILLVDTGPSMSLFDE